VEPEAANLEGPTAARGPATTPLDQPDNGAPRPAASTVPLTNPWYVRAWRWVASYFTDFEPTVLLAFTPYLLLALVLFTRDPHTNYIFDEQEALLANPYVNARDNLTYWDAIHRDFWGLPPTASIGSYRPIPDLLWRAIWQISDHRLAKHPFIHHLYNVVLHALNGALLCRFIYLVSKRRRFAWFAGAIFVACAVLTEAVSGIVGIADVLGGLGAISALLALRLRAHWMPVAVFAAVTFGLFSKESALVCVPLIPIAALLTAPHLHPERPARVMRTLLALAAALGAFVLYVELRKGWFPSPLPAALKAPLDPEAGELQKLYRELLVWFHQAPLPKDPLNNPLAEADRPHRIAGGLRVYWRGLTQVVFPWTLSGDYSYPQEPIPKTLYGWETIAGGIMMVAPPIGAVVVTIGGWVRERRAALALRAGRAVDGIVALAATNTKQRLLGAGIVMLVAGTVGVVTEMMLLRRGGPTYVTTWPVSAGIIAMGFGLITEGWSSTKTPLRAARGWPLRLLTPSVVALGMVWVVASYFPHSNIPVTLPTVRAERFWYFPAIGSAMLLALLFDWLFERLPRRKLWGPFTPALTAFLAFFLFQATRTYMHAMDYENDLTFWEATKNAVPNSAKAHLNYSVMKGARKDLETRLVESKIALELAPQWPMAHIYTGDTLCRMHRAEEAWPYYRDGFELGPNDRSLIALALQCLWDEKEFERHENELRALADKHIGSWIAFLAIDVINNGEANKGVSPQYRPRGYNEGPRD